MKKRGYIYNVYREKKGYKQFCVVLSILLLISVLAVPTYANIQIPVDGVTVENVYYIIGENIITGESMIRPTMTVGWTDPDNWASAIDPADIHTPDFYDVNVKSITTGREAKVTVSRGSDAYNNKLLQVHEQTNLDTGSLYEIKVNPYHYHTVEGIPNLAPVSGITKKAYAITDLQVSFESSEDTITVIWDNVGIPEFQYRIVYALGDYSTQTKQALIDNKEGDISGITLDSDDVNSFYDPISKRNKLSYTITENVYPGQVYSVMVEPLVDYYESIPVTRNRNYPVINNVSTNINLSYSEEGETLRLQWDIPASFKVGSANDQYELVETKLLKYRDGQGQSIAILNGIAGAIGYYTVNKPLVETGYQLQLTYKAVDDESKPTIEPISNLLIFSPSQVAVIPTKPVVPDLLSKAILDELRSSYGESVVRDILAEDYLVPGSSYLGNLDTIFDAKITYNLDVLDNSVNFAWGAFRRIDIDQTSATYNKYITDLNTYYDIWMTDSYDALSYATRILGDQRFSSLDTSSIIKSESGVIVGFHMNLDAYYNNDSGELETIRPNKVYYIKVQAKKKLGTQEITSEPTIVSFYYTDNGDSYAPPLITKPPLHVKDDATTPTSVTLAWKEEWWEVINPAANSGDPLENWSNEVWVTSSGTISTSPIEGADYFQIYDRESEVTRLSARLATLGVTIESRKIDLGTDPFGISNIYYKFLKIPYKDVDAQIKLRQKVEPSYSFLEYFDELVKGDKDGSNPLAWRNILTTVNPDKLDEVLYKESGLLPNTSYLFIVYPYRILYDNVHLEAHYPTPIIVATEPEPIEINPDPIVPSMYITNYSDRSISLSWQYNTDFSYEIRYSLEDDPKTALPFTIELPENSNDPNYPVNGLYYEVTIPDLFPNTGYYFFIRAIQPKTNATSLWSTPLFGVTTDVPIPPPPRGLGVAPKSMMLEHDYEEAVTEDYITVAWLKDVGDVEGINDESEVKIYYSYILEVANNEKFIDPIYIVSGDDDSITPDNVEILEKNLVKVNNLVSNRHYYFRMKTRVTVVGNLKGQLIVKESDYYSPFIRILTIASDKEYDSGSDPALEILPSENFEIIYDSDKQELTFRFRDDSLDSDGHADNNVDQRLISDLIKQNLYTYDIDISSFDNKPIVKRKVIIPYSIVQAFDSYEIELQIDAGNLLMNLPHDAFMKEVNKQKKQYGVAPSLELTIEDVDAYYEYSRMPENALQSVSIPQEMTVRVKSSKMNTSLDFTDVPIELGISTNSRFELYGKSPVVYSLDPDQRWEKVVGTYDRINGAYMMKTANIGSYGVFLMEESNEIVSSVPSHWSEKYKAKIDGMYTVLGLSGYNPNGYIKEDEYVNVLYSLILGDEIIDTQRYLSTEQLKSLNYAGIKKDLSKGDPSLNREEAIAMMMRTLEIRDNLTLAADVNMINAVNKNTQIDSVYKDLLAKAATIGLVSDISKVRANDKLTYGEFFALWAKAEGGF